MGESSKDAPLVGSDGSLKLEFDGSKGTPDGRGREPICEIPVKMNHPGES
jgi:hypothetical protein